MEDFDDNLTQTLDVYLEYLRSFVTMIQGDSSLLISTYQKNLLEQEWDFIKNICPHIPGGEARSGLWHQLDLAASCRTNIYHVKKGRTLFVLQHSLHFILFPIPRGGGGDGGGGASRSVTEEKEEKKNLKDLRRAGNTFCQMACGMLASIGDFLRMGTDEIVKNMYELSDSIDEEDMRTR